MCAGEMNDRLHAEIESLHLDIPQDIMDRIDEQVRMKENQIRITPRGLTRELMAIAPDCKGRMRWSVILACVGELFSFAAYFFSAYAASWLIARGGANPPGFDSLVRCGLAAAASLLVYLLLTGISTTLSHRTSFNILGRLRGRLFAKLREVPLGYLVENPVGKIKTIIQDRVADMEDWVAHLMPELPSRLLHPLLCVVILFVLDWRLGLAVFAPLPLILIGMAAMMYRYRGRSLVWLCGYANVADRSAEYVRGIPVIKAFLQDRRSYDHFADAVNFYHHSTMQWWRQSWFGSALSMAAMMSPLLATLPVAFYLYANGRITVSTLLLALILPLSILPQSFAIMQSFELFQVASNTWLSIRALLGMPPQKRPPGGQNAALNRDLGIAFDHVCFSYQEGSEVLHDISFTAEKGEVTALVGPSGGGKSTVARLLAGFWDQSSGVIRLGGADTREIPFEQLYSEISYVSQDNFLFDCSIKDNIRMGKPDASDEEIQAAAKAAHCHDFIMALPNGYDTSAGDAGGALSGGERQRITLARAILKPAATIILDEATAYADPENEALIQEAISHLVRGKSLLVVAHRLHTIKQAHKIIVLDKGTIAAQGTHAQLIESCQLYRKLWRQYAGKED